MIKGGNMTRGQTSETRTLAKREQDKREKDDQKKLTKRLPLKAVVASLMASGVIGLSLVSCGGKDFTTAEGTSDSAVVEDAKADKADGKEGSVPDAPKEAEDTGDECKVLADGGDGGCFVSDASDVSIPDVTQEDSNEKDLNVPEVPNDVKDSGEEEGGSVSPWKYKVQCNVTTGLDAGVDLPDFATHCIFDTASPVVGGKMKGDCGDARMIDKDGNFLSYEIGKGSCNTAHTVVYFRFDTAKGGMNNEAWLLYGNAVAQDAQDPQDVWKAYGDVWHFDESNLIYSSSTGKTQLNNTAYTPFAMPADPSCKIGGCLNAQTGGIYGATAEYLNPPITASCWINIKTSDTSSPDNVFSRARDSFDNARWQFVRWTTGNYAAYTSGGTKFYGTFPVTINSWVLATIQIPDASTVKIFENGELVDSGAFVMGPNTGNRFSIGYSGAATTYKEFLKGYADECWISSDVKSADWIKAVANVNYTLGSEQAN